LAAEMASEADGIYIVMPFHKNAVAMTVELVKAARGNKVNNSSAQPSV